MADIYKSPERQKDGSIELTDTKKPGIEEKCDVAEAFQSDPSRRARIGHVSAVTVAGVTLKPDLALADPMWANLTTKPATFPKFAGVLQSVSWEGGKTDPMTFHFLVSAANWQLATGVEYEEDEGAEDDQTFEACEIAFCVYDYDPVAKLVYKSFHSNNAELEGEFRFNEQDYDVANTAFEGIRSPLLYAMKLVVKPKLVAFSVMVGFGHQRTVTKGWGDAGIKARQAAAKADEERKKRRVERQKAKEDAKREKQEALRQKDQKELEKGRAKENKAKAAKKEKEDEQKRQKSIVDAEAARVKAAEDAERSAKLALDLARQAEAAAGEAALTQAQIETAQKVIDAAQAERARIIGNADARSSKIEDERDAALRGFEEREGKEIEAAEQAAQDAERGVWEAEIALDEEKRKLVIARADAQVNLQAAKGAAARKFAEEIHGLDAKLLEIEAKRLEAEAARRRHGATPPPDEDAVTAQRDAARTAFCKPFDDRIKAIVDAAKAESAAADDRILKGEAEIRRLKQVLRDREKALEVTEGETRFSETVGVAKALESRALTAQGNLTRSVAASTTRADSAAEAVERVERRWRAIAAGIAQNAAALEQLEAGIAEAHGVAEACATALAPHAFEQELSITLKLTLGTAIHELPGGTVTRFSIDAHTFGFTGEIEFLRQVDSGTDALLADFTATKLGEVELAVKSKFQPATDPPDPLKLKGLILTRDVCEESYDALAEAQVLMRRYRFTFADAAQVLWKQHFPCDLFVDQTLQQVIDLQKGGKITITGDWGAHLGTAKPIIFLSLGDERGGASFYDFLVWYLDRNLGVLTYDTTTNAYAILGAKPAGAKTRKLDPNDVEELEVRFPDVPRHAVNVLNVWSEAATKKTAIASDLAVTGVRQDPLTRTEIAARFEDRGKLETARLVPRRPELHVTFASFPSVTFAPGEIVDFSSPGWAAAIYPKSKGYRVRRYSIEARKAGSSSDAAAGSTYGNFGLTIEAVLEEKGDTAPYLPPYETPVYPAFVEAKIVAVGGVDLDRTFLVVDDKKTSISYYKVDVPLWNKKIPAHFHPGQVPGHFFFPAYKHERVLIALDLFSAEIKRFIDWAPRGRLPIDTQGNHILLGKRETDETSIRHTYVDAKAVFTIERLKAGDTQVLTISEGLLSMLVKAEAGAVETPPKFDVTMQVESAKGDLTMQGGGAVADVSGQMGGALAGPSGALGGAQEELSGELGSMSAEIGADVGAVRGELEGKLGALGAAGEELDAEVGAAIAEIESAMQ